jgi:2-polyprenyl-3-methyl-5-hydroxy-6-metoxy-1,4-benzoquinol methylase
VSGLDRKVTTVCKISLRAVVTVIMGFIPQHRHTCIAISCRTSSYFVVVLFLELRVLDVGCGNGYTVGEFLKRGCAVVGIDLSESGISLARRVCPQPGLRSPLPMHRFWND